MSPVSDPAEPQPNAVPPVPTAPQGAWAPPAVPPFGAPQTSGGTAGAYAPPAGYAPPPGYPVPAGYSASAPYGYGAANIATPTPARSPALGRVSLLLSLIATGGAGLVAAIASFNIGLGAGRELTMRPFDAGFDWSVLTPVREWVLMGEIAFWVGTALGIWALIQGIVAIVTRRGRGAGIAAVVIAAVGPFVFAALVQGFLTAGLAAGTGIGG